LTLQQCHHNMLRTRLQRLAACSAVSFAFGTHHMTRAEPSLTPQTLFSLDGRTALITGGSKGLGKAIARGLALAGADVIITSRQESELRTSLQEILLGTNVKGDYIVADLSKPGEAQKLAKEAMRRSGGRIDIFINNAGVSKPGSIHKGVAEGIPSMSAADWDLTLATNLSAGVHLLNELAPAMVQNKWGRVVHISSIGGLGSSEGRSAYSASKAAMIGITNAGALELGPHNVTVNCICPGPFLTDMPLKALKKETIDAVSSKVPLRRWGQPNEIVGPTMMLVSEAGAYVNGAVLRVDGGLLSRAY